MKTSLVVSGLIILFLSSCVGSKNDFSEIGNGCFSIMVPKNLQQPSEKQEGAVVHLCEDTTEFLAGLSVVVYSDNIYDEKDSSTLYSYYNFVANNLLDETLDSGTLDLPKDTLINGLNSLLFKVSGMSTSENTNEIVTYYTGIYQGKTKFYELTVWCKKNDVPKYFDTIQEILRSFKENRDDC